LLLDDEELLLLELELEDPEEDDDELLLELDEDDEELVEDELDDELLELVDDVDELEDDTSGPVVLLSVQPAIRPTPARATLPDRIFKNSRRRSRSASSSYGIDGLTAMHAPPCRRAVQAPRQPTAPLAPGWRTPGRRFAIPSAALR
jgi:hypothetical protein